MPLVEIVTEPDLKSPKEARIFLGKLRSILEYLDVFDGDLEGAMRVDANISIEGGNRAEVKNISSHKGVERALSFEITRQKNLVRRGLNVRKQEIPELPDEKRKRFLAQYSITPEHASSLIYDPHIADYYEDVASKIDPRLSATWIADVLKGELNYRSSSMREASKRISHDEFVTILRYFEQGVDNKGDA
jgi:aspartyl-tRNA(Asn)/glutamyl-tRNA(Gln) amidotransferase subunit B